MTASTYGAVSKVSKAGDTMTGTLVLPGLEMTTGPAVGSVMTSDAAGNASWQPAGSVSVLSYGADRTGVADSTTAIQNAVNAALGPVYFPSGTYLISSAITLPDRAVLIGAGSGSYTHDTGNPLSIIKLANASNSSMFTIATGHGGGRIMDLQLNGNKTNQTGGGSAILFTAGSAAEESQWHLVRAYVHDAYSSGIETQQYRQNNKIIECVVYNCGGYGINSSAIGSVIANCTIGQNTLDGILASTVCHIHACDIWGNRSGINVPATIRGVEITNCGVDHNQQHGIYIAGSGVNVLACTLHSNGQATTNTYGSITVDDTPGAVDGVTIAHCNFWLDAGITNLPNYHVWFKTGTSTAQVTACSYRASSYATGTVNTLANAAVTQILAQANIGGSTSAASLASLNASSTAPLWDGAAVADTTSRFYGQHDGVMQWGPGNTARDTNLYRAGVGSLKTDTGFVVGGSLTVAGVGSVQTAFKAGDTSRNTTTTLTADPDLTLNVLANATYALDCFLQFLANSPPDIKVDWTIPTSATMNWAALGTGLANFTDHDASVVPNNTARGAKGNGGVIQSINTRATLITAGNTGALTLRWAQNTSNAAATVLKAGSWIRLTRMA